jgi:putative sterol carrier protein
MSGNQDPQADTSAVDAQDVVEQIDTSTVNADDVVKMISVATDEQLHDVIEGPQRDAILGEIFRRMEEHFNPGSASDLDAVIHWKITGPDGEDHWEAVISGGKCATSSEPKSDPRVTLKLDGPNFLRLVTGNAAGPILFMTQKLRIDGDIAFSARLPSMFKIPG